MTMRVLVVEDEPVIARRLVRLLGEILQEPGRVINTARSLNEAHAVLAQARYNVLCLDLNLHGRDGFELLASAVAGPHQTIVVSANTDRALEAFEYGVVDFVPKPFDRDRLEKALARVSATDRPESQRARVLSFRDGSRTRVIKVEQVRAIHGADNYAEVELDDGRRLLHDKTLDQLEGLLPRQFRRVHRSHILNLERIVGLENRPGSRYRARLDSGEGVPVSRSRIRQLRDFLR